MSRSPNPADKVKPPPSPTSVAGIAGVAGEYSFRFVPEKYYVNLVCGHFSVRCGVEKSNFEAICENLDVEAKSNILRLEYMRYNQNWYILNPKNTDEGFLCTIIGTVNQALRAVVINDAATKRPISFKTTKKPKSKKKAVVSGRVCAAHSSETISVTITFQVPKSGQGDVYYKTYSPIEILGSDYRLLSLNGLIEGEHIQAQQVGSTRQYILRNGSEDGLQVSIDSCQAAQIGQAVVDAALKMIKPRADSGWRESPPPRLSDRTGEQLRQGSSVTSICMRDGSKVSIVTTGAKKAYSPNPFQLLSYDCAKKI